MLVIGKPAASDVRLVQMLISCLLDSILYGVCFSIYIYLFLDIFVADIIGYVADVMWICMFFITRNWHITKFDKVIQHIECLIVQLLGATVDW